MKPEWEAGEEMIKQALEEQALQYPEIQPEIQPPAGPRQEAVVKSRLASGHSGSDSESSPCQAGHEAPAAITAQAARGRIMIVPTLTTGDRRTACHLHGAAPGPSLAEPARLCRGCCTASAHIHPSPTLIGKQSSHLQKKKSDLRPVGGVTRTIRLIFGSKVQAEGFGPRPLTLQLRSHPSQ